MNTFKSNIFLSIFFGLFAFNLASQTVDHSKWDAILKKHVTAAGVVDYSGLKIKKVELKAILTQYAQINPATLKSNEQLAFYINLYNLATVQLIVDNYPLKSIKDLDAGKPWDVKRIMLNGQKKSLNDIENNIVRPTFKDPRIHFALNCGAVSCPPLLNAAFTGVNVQKLLDAQTKAFVNNKSSTVVQASSLKLSRIFDWYKTDFGDVTSFLNKYLTTPVAKGASLAYLEYNWAVNGK